MEDKRIALAVCARMLGYPEEGFHADKDELFAALRTGIGDSGLRRRTERALEPLYGVLLKDLRETYVWTFDWKEKTGLYLTAHELGDSRERGAALILLQHIVRDAGFRPAEGELSDYIPMLLELLAARPDNVHVQALELRLAAAVKEISDHLPEDSPYKGLFGLLLGDVFPPLSEEQIMKLTSKRETADLDELPYPILFGINESPSEQCGFAAYKKYD
ncbi:nitrate reductase molybdenum cofactor assembly chaperone [Paenibacillus sp. M1]|uniref:Nitrate reductase molybdenum cofactor assembly chaperone n=1 Tax=Paenibacillus haidiansis TaxID=1574488 RepID=A0ABU7VSV1_9BACL